MDSGPLRSALAGANRDAGQQAFVAVSRFEVANGLEEEVKEAFRRRPHLVDDAPGFLGLEVLCPLERPREIWLVTWWSEESAYRHWHRSHLYHESHRGIPRGLKLVRGSARVELFERVCR